MPKNENLSDVGFRDLSASMLRTYDKGVFYLSAIPCFFITTQCHKLCFSNEINYQTIIANHNHLTSDWVVIFINHDGNVLNHIPDHLFDITGLRYGIGYDMWRWAGFILLPTSILLSSSSIYLFVKK